jgi:hypothetical protein
LIKDYVVYIINERKRRSTEKEKYLNIKLFPFISRIDEDEKVKIQEMLLAKVIQKYITDCYIRKAATIAVWLGNDEVHMVRKCGLNLSYLQELVDLSVDFIVIKKIRDKE